MEVTGGSGGGERYLELTWDEAAPMPSVEEIIQLSGALLTLVSRVPEPGHAPRFAGAPLGHTVFDELGAYACSPVRPDSAPADPAAVHVPEGELPLRQCARNWAHNRHQYEGTGTQAFICPGLAGPTAPAMPDGGPHTIQECEGDGVHPSHNWGERLDGTYEYHCPGLPDKQQS